MRRYAGLVAAVAFAGALASDAAIAARVPPTPPDLAAIAFASPTVGWAVGPGLIWRTGDGGRIWHAQYKGKVDLSGLDAVSTAVAYAWGGDRLWRTGDGGRVWQALRMPLTGNPNLSVLSLSAVGPHIVYTVVGSTVVTASGAYVSRNGGGTWAPLRTPFTCGQIAFASATDGWAITRLGADVYRTTDGGRTWSRSFTAPVPVSGPSFGAAITAEGRYRALLLLLGSGGMTQESYSVYHTGDALHWTPVIAVPTAGGGPAPGNPRGVSTGPMIPGGMGSSPGPLASVAGLAVLVGVCQACTGPTADVVRSTDAGRTWGRPIRLTDSEGWPTLADLSLPSPRVGYLAVPGIPGRRTAVFATHNGGRTWRIVWRSKR